MPQVSEVEAFRHMADSYRWLVCAECSINDLRRVLPPEDVREARRLLPNADVAFVASALVYGRGLIEFFASDNDHFSELTARSAFGYACPPDHPSLRWLVSVKRAINTHLMHFSNRRERYERGGVDRIEWAGPPGGPPGQVHALVDHLLELLQVLGTAAESGTHLAAHWEHLHELAKARRADRTTQWIASWDLDGVR